MTDEERFAAAVRGLYAALDELRAAAKLGPGPYALVLSDASDHALFHNCPRFEDACTILLEAARQTQTGDAVTLEIPR